MEINIQEINFTINIKDDKEHPDLLAYLSIIFIEEHGRKFACNGFTIRKSKFDGKPYIAMPSKRSGNGFFVFNLIEKTLFKEIEREAIRQYEHESIPVIED